MLPSKSATFTAVAAAALASGLSLWTAPRAAAQAAAATPSVSTAPAGEPRQEGGNRGEEFRQRMEERLKGQLKVSDDEALRAALENDNTTVNDIKTKLQAVRDQRKQATTELAQSREELRKVLNMRQEAILVMYGLLD